jgi:hypothetical protein
MLICCIGLVLFQCGLLHGNGIPVLVLINVYVAFYAIGLGPIPFLWIAEMVEPRYVAVTMTICSQLNWMMNFLVGLLFPIMKEHLEGFTFVPFAVVLAVSFLVVWRILPDNRNNVIPITKNTVMVGQ